MGNPFLWEQAGRFDNTLQGDDWPTNMTPSQIAKLHFHADEGRRKTLLALLYKKADSGGIEFDDITETYSWPGSSVSIGYAAQSGYAANVVRGMYRATRDKQLSDGHRPDCGWGKLLKGIGPGESIPLAYHACDCEAICSVETVFHNGLPKRWRIQGTHSDGFKIDFSCTAEPLISTTHYIDFCCDNCIPAIPGDSPLLGWEFEAAESKIPAPSSEEEIDRLKVHAIAAQWLKQFPLSEFPSISTRTVKKHPRIIPYYEKYPGRDPVKPDRWLVEAGIPKGKPGGESNADKEFTELFLKSF